LSDEENRKLTLEQYRVLCEKGTERPFTGKHLNETRTGTYKCAGCGHVVFTSDAKFDSGCGWPSFDRPASDDAVEMKKDLSHFMVRTEILCPKCGGHLGHVFDDGPTDTGKRYCINSVALDFIPE
jgi:methionine-R-sulfoxide reductase